MKIAITGTIGSGKTEVSRYLRNKGYVVFDCDQYNSCLLQEGSEAYPLIKKNFPIVFSDGILNKKKLAEIIFNDIRQKELLESILHPLIVEEMLRQSQINDFFFAEVPLLFEKNLDKYFDVSWLVVCEEHIALKRLSERGLTLEDARVRIINQMSVENKMLRANEIIYNNDTLESLWTKVENLLKRYVR